VWLCYLATLALLPWARFPPFPWLHQNAQWSDATFLVAAGLWLVDRCRSDGWGWLRPFHAALLAYFCAALVSLLFATPAELKTVGAAKVLGIGELCALTAVTADLARRPGAVRGIARTVAASTILTALACAVGLLLYYTGIHNRLIGAFGDLPSSPYYARVQGAFDQPRMLGGYCIFAAAVIAHGEAELPTALRRFARASVWTAELLTFSRAVPGFLAAEWLRSARTVRARRIAGSAAVLVGCLLLLSNYGAIRFNPVRPAEATLDFAAGSMHRDTIETAAQAIVSRPFTGTGPGTNPGWHGDFNMEAHLTPVNIAGTLGLPALLAFAALLWLLWSGRRPGDAAVWCGLAGLALDGLTGAIEDHRHMWVLLGLAAAGLAAPPRRPAED